MVCVLLHGLYKRCGTGKDIIFVLVCFIISCGIVCVLAVVTGSTVARQSAIFAVVDHRHVQCLSDQPQSHFIFCTGFNTQIQAATQRKHKCRQLLLMLMINDSPFLLNLYGPLAFNFAFSICLRQPNGLFFWMKCVIDKFSRKRAKTCVRIISSLWLNESLQSLFTVSNTSKYIHVPIDSFAITTSVSKLLFCGP